MPAKPVQISIDSDLLERIDADPDARAHGRSAFVRAAVERYLAAKERSRIDKSIHAAYSRSADKALADTAALMGAQEWPAD